MLFRQCYLTFFCFSSSSPSSPSFSSSSSSSSYSSTVVIYSNSQCRHLPIKDSKTSAAPTICGVHRQFNSRCLTCSHAEGVRCAPVDCPSDRHTPTMLYEPAS